MEDYKYYMQYANFEKIFGHRMMLVVLVGVYRYP